MPRKSGIVTNICRNCAKLVCDNQKGINYSKCLYWYHMKCINISIIDYNRLSHCPEFLFCQTCICDILPFCSLDDREFAHIFSNYSLLNFYNIDLNKCDSWRLNPFKLNLDLNDQLDLTLGNNVMCSYFLHQDYNACVSSTNP